MTIHGAEGRISACGKPVKRRWHVRHQPYIEVTVFGWKEVDQRPEITCKACRKVLGI